MDSVSTGKARQPTTALKLIEFWYHFSIQRFQSEYGALVRMCSSKANLGELQCLHHQHAGTRRYLPSFSTELI